MFLNKGSRRLQRLGWLSFSWRRLSPPPIMHMLWLIQMSWKVARLICLEKFQDCCLATDILDKLQYGSSGLNGSGQGLSLHYMKINSDVCDFKMFLGKARTHISTNTFCMTNYLQDFFLAWFLFTWFCRYRNISFSWCNMILVITFYGGACL